MDIQSLYDLTQHFVNAVHVAPLISEASTQLVDTFQNITTALTEKDAMSPSERLFQVGKLAVSAAGMTAAFAMGGGVFGVAGFAIPEVEAVRELNAKGAAFRATHPSV